MTNHTEARLAREAEIAYASLSMVTDYDCWNQTKEEVSVEMVIENLKINTEVANKIIFETAKVIDINRPDSKAHQSLKDGLMTSKGKASREAHSKVRILTDKYWC